MSIKMYFAWLIIFLLKITRVYTSGVNSSKLKGVASWKTSTQIMWWYKLPKLSFLDMKQRSNPIQTQTRHIQYSFFPDSWIAMASFINHSVIFSKCFILVSIVVDPVTIPRTMSERWEYALDTRLFRTGIIVNQYYSKPRCPVSTKRSNVLKIWINALI